MDKITITEVKEGVVRIDLRDNTILCQSHEVFNKLIKGECQIEVYNGIINYSPKNVNQDNIEPDNKTKFSIGSEVYLMRDNKPTKVEVNKIVIEETITENKVFYDLKIDSTFTVQRVEENNIFKTKQELLNSL